MNLNQILFDEQIAMMRHSRATSMPEVGEHRREIDRIGKMLSLLTYPHRPYPAAGPAKLPSEKRKTLRLAIRGRWETEKGAA